ncbi:hypothetical protein [Mesorhizobium sp. M0701]|uniref:hypothetical protein n=1 Tax=Mesorhizobium sp. M0701 TaxID=2956989 RepID=UPI0033393766
MNIPDWQAQHHQLLSLANDAIQAGDTARAVRSRFAADESSPSGFNSRAPQSCRGAAKACDTSKAGAVGSKLHDQSRVWKVELQQLARETGLALHMASPSDGHIDVEQHRTPLFCRITDGALLDRATRVELIAVTTTKRAEVGRAVDSASDEKREQVNDVEMEALAI